jgi:hypothetical protein
MTPIRSREKGNEAGRVSGPAFLCGFIHSGDDYDPVRVTADLEGKDSCRAFLTSI